MSKSTEKVLAIVGGMLAVLCGALLVTFFMI